MRRPPSGEVPCAFSRESSCLGPAARVTSKADCPHRSTGVRQLNTHPQERPRTSGSVLGSGLRNRCPAPAPRASIEDRPPPSAEGLQWLGLADEPLQASSRDRSARNREGYP